MSGPGVDAADRAAIADALAQERRRTLHQIDALRRDFDDIVEAAELTSTDDEHDPDGATIAYERAKAWALLRQARADLEALDDVERRLADGSVATCELCAGPIALERLLALPHTRRCIRCAV